MFLMQTSEVVGTTKVTRPGLQRLCASVESIRDQVHFPCYCYDWATLEDTARLILASAQDVGLDFRFCLAFFALPNVSLFKRLMALDERLGINCNTLEEIIALRGAGWNDWSRVSFSGGVLPERELVTTAQSGCIVNAASRGNLEILLRDFDSSQIGLRLDFTGMALKGIRLAEVGECFEDAERHRTQITALHAYPGTEVDDLEALLRHAELLLEVAAESPTVKEVNFGGGFSFNYRHPTGLVSDMADFSLYFAAVSKMAAMLLGDRTVRLSWEPGRIMFAGAGFFVTEVIAVRTTSPRTMDVYVDASFTQIPALKIRDRQHKVVVLDSKGDRKDGARFESRLCGATTLSTDQLLPRPCLLPEVEPGDLIVILDVGAYGRAGSYNFLGKAQPPEILLEDTDWQVIRRRQDADHLLQGIGDACC